MQRWVSTITVCSLVFAYYIMHAFVGVLSMVYAFMVLRFVEHAM